MGWTDDPPSEQGDQSGFDLPVPARASAQPPSVETPSAAPENQQAPVSAPQGVQPAGVEGPGPSQRTRQPEDVPLPAAAAPQTPAVHWTELEPTPAEELTGAAADVRPGADEDPWLQQDRRDADSAWDGGPVPRAPSPRVSLDQSFVFGADASDGFSIRRVSRSLLAIGVVLLLVAGSLVFWFSRAGGGGVALAIEMHPGPATSYLMTLKVQGTVSANGNSASMSGSVAAHLQWKVLSVDADGVADVQLTMSKISAREGGKSSKVKGPVRMTVRIAPDGRMLGGTDLSFLGDGTGGLPGTSQFVPVLPDHPVKPGDTWSLGYEQKNSIGYGSIDVAATGRLMNIRSEAGREIAMVETKETVPLHLTLDVAQLAKAYGVKDVPKGAKITYSGQVLVTQYSWIDTVAKQLVRSTTDARFHVDMTVEGVDGLPNGTTLTLDGSMDLGLTQPHAPAGLSL